MVYINPMLDHVYVLPTNLPVHIIQKLVAPNAEQLKLFEYVACSRVYADGIYIDEEGLYHEYNYGANIVNLPDPELSHTVVGPMLIVGTDKDGNAVQPSSLVLVHSDMDAKKETAIKLAFKTADVVNKSQIHVICYVNDEDGKPVPHQFKGVSHALPENLINQIYGITTD